MPIDRQNTWLKQADQVQSTKTGRRVGFVLKGAKGTERRCFNEIKTVWNSDQAELALALLLIVAVGASIWFGIAQLFEKHNITRNEMKLVLLATAIDGSTKDRPLKLGVHDVHQLLIERYGDLPEDRRVEMAKDNWGSTILVEAFSPTEFVVLSPGPDGNVCTFKDNRLFEYNDIEGHHFPNAKLFENCPSRPSPDP